MLTFCSETLYCFCVEMTKDSNTRLRGVKEEPHDLQRDVNSSLTKFESSIEIKLDGMS